MNVLSAQKLSKSYGEKVLFEDLSLTIDDEDRVALIGVNGCGKSSLLKMLARAEPLDSGGIAFRQDLRIEYLPQNPVFDDAQTVLEYVFASDRGEAALVRDYEAACHALETDHDNPALQRRFEELSHAVDAAGAWEYETRAKTVLTRLNIHDFDARIGALSGGYRKRLALAHALLSESDLLILDEPTNHLDADTIEWLEEYLRRFSGAVLLVTHDRYFLERVAKRILEIDHRQGRMFEGNFSFYLEHKAEQEAEAARQEDKRRNILRNEMTWLLRGCRARRTKSKDRVLRVKAMAAEKAEAPRASVTFNIQTRRLGNKIVEIEGVSKSFEGRPILRDFSYNFAAGERIGIIGPNGSGKTTLANLITGRIAPDSGKVVVGDTVYFGYYDQESHGLDPRERAIDYVKREGGELLRGVDGSVQSAEIVMKQFLFTSQTLYTPIENLSGGERRRLYLVRTLMESPNFLVLDEPTNDLDIQTLQALEDFLDGFSGCLIVISHDRYFLDRTVDEVFAIQPDGTLRGFPGSYSVYARTLEEEAEAAAASEASAAKNASGAKGAPSASKSDGKAADGSAKLDRPRKLSFKEQRELDHLETEIPRMEERMGALQEEMAEAATDYARLRTLSEEQTQLEANLETAMGRWLELSSIPEAKG